MSKRLAIRDGFISEIREKLGGAHSTEFFTELPEALVGEFKTFEELREFPYVAVNMGTETVEYQPSRQRWKWLNMTIFAYVKEHEDSKRETELENLISDLEKIIDSHEKIRYTINKPDGSQLEGHVIDRSIQSINTDEGLLAPFGFAEISFIVRYTPDSRLL